MEIGVEVQPYVWRMTNWIDPETAYVSELLRAISLEAILFLISRFENEISSETERIERSGFAQRVAQDVNNPNHHLYCVLYCYYLWKASDLAHALLHKTPRYLESMTMGM